jgi:hypothetical protein
MVTAIRNLAVQLIIDNQQVFKSQARQGGGPVLESGGGLEPPWFRRATPTTLPNIYSWIRIKD